MKPLFKRGETVYYDNRNTKQAEKCTVVDWVCQYPMAYIAKTTHREKFLNVIMILDVLHRSKKHMMMLKSRRIE